MPGGTRKQKEKKKFSFLPIQKSNVIKRNWVLVFSFMYLVSVDQMGRSYLYNSSFYMYFRYIAIVKPLRPRISKLWAIMILCAIWVGSGLLAIPAVLYSKTWTFNYEEGNNVTVCFLLWPDGPPTVSELDYM